MKDEKCCEKMRWNAYLMFPPINFKERKFVFAIYFVSRRMKQCAFFLKHKIAGFTLGFVLHRMKSVLAMRNSVKLYLRDAFLSKPSFSHTSNKTHKHICTAYASVRSDMEKSTMVWSYVFQVLLLLYSSLWLLRHRAHAYSCCLHFADCSFFRRYWCYEDCLQNPSKEKKSLH